MNTLRLIQLVAALLAGFAVWFPQIQVKFFGGPVTDNSSTPSVWQSLLSDMFALVIMVLTVAAGNFRDPMPIWGGPAVATLSIGLAVSPLYFITEVKKRPGAMVAGGAALGLVCVLTLFVTGVIQVMQAAVGH